MVKVQRLFAKTNLKIRVCAAQRSNESPSGAFKRPNGLAQQDGGASPRQVQVCRNRSKQGLGQARPNKKQSQRGRKFSRIENLWPRDDSCSHTFNLFAFFFLESLSFFRYNKIERRWRNDFAILCNRICHREAYQY